MSFFFLQARISVQTVKSSGPLCFISCWLCFALTEEKYVEEVEQRPILTELSGLFKVKGFLSVIIVWVASYIAFNIMMSSSVYYIMYCVMRPDLITYYMLDISLIGVLGIIFLIPVLMKTFHRTEKAFAVSQVIVIVCYAVILLFHSSLPILFIFSGIGAMFATASMPFAAVTMSEMTDLESTGYIAGAIGQETPAVIMGITCARFLAPIICAVIVVLALLKYPVTQQKRKGIREMYEKAEEGILKIK